MQETKDEMIDVNVFVNEINLPPKNGVTQSYYTTFRITGLALSAETETWLISSHLCQKCAFTALEFLETMLKLTDIFFFIYSN